LGRRRYTRAQVWEATIVLIIIAIVLYRLALVYDYVPREYQPSNMADKLYSDVKANLAAKSNSQSFGGQLASGTLDKLLAIETYVKKQQEHYRISQEASERCQENMIFRYFMFMGDETNPNCSPQNMRLEEAVKEINNSSSNKTPAAESFGNNNPSAPTTIPTQTTPAPTSQPPTTSNSNTATPVQNY